jgi:uncharacterized protein YjiK
MKYIIVILVIALVGVGYIYKDHLAGVTGNESSKDKKEKKKDEKGAASAEIGVAQQWALPDKLKEISGLSYLGPDRFACVQDESGILFIYNTADNKIEKEVPFGGAGDYEGLTLVGDDAYVVKSDGTLIGISNWNIKPVTTQYKTSLTAEHNVEGLVYDKAGNRLLLAIKDDEPTTKAYKGVYAFDLGAKSFNSNPVYKIDMNSIPGPATGKKKKGFQPSAIAKHPSSNDLYIVDGPSSRLMVMDAQGNIKQVYALGNAFEQPEGITFGPGGELFISNEGVKGPGNIIQVTIK